MTRYWVEFKGYDDNYRHVSVYIYAYSEKQIRDMLPEYDVMCVEEEVA